MMQQRNKKKQEWSPEETDLLKSLYAEFTSKKWKRMVQEFKARGFSRTETECRDRWINFVDPSINKREWEEWELRRMYEIHSQMGSRWSLVQKEISRTQNQIKNRFYGTLRNYIRFLLNYFDSGRSCLNYQITKLSPKFLNEMYNSQNQFQYLNGEVKATIFQMGFKVQKKILSQRIRQKRSLYTKLHQLLTAAFQSLHQLPHSASLNSLDFQKHDQLKLEESSHQAMVTERHSSEQLVKKEQHASEEVNLPRTSLSLQNAYQHQGYQNFFLMMQYNQPNPALFYYVLSYL